MESQKGDQPEGAKVLENLAFSALLKGSAGAPDAGRELIFEKRKKRGLLTVLEERLDHTQHPTTNIQKLATKQRRSRRLLDGLNRVTQGTAVPRHY